jgi:hypothetical protein
MKSLTTLAVLVLVNAFSTAYAADPTADRRVGVAGGDCTTPAALRSAPAAFESGDPYDFLTKYNP